MEKSNQTPFIYPIPFDQFSNARKTQQEALHSQFSVQELSKVRKLKKLLESTEEKINNRIKLFKKISMDIQKKKDKENKIHERIQNVKKSNVNFLPLRLNETGHTYMQSTKSSSSGIRIRKTTDIQRDSRPRKIECFFSQKNENVNEVKMLKERNKIILQQRRIKQMRQKVKSASLIRNNRIRVKEVKMMCENERLEEARRMKEERFKDEIKQYDELQQNLTRLQREEREALIMWKLAMQQS